MLIKVNHRWLEVECESNNFRKQIQSYNHDVSIQIVCNVNMHLIKEIYVKVWKCIKRLQTEKLT